MAAKKKDTNGSESKTWKMGTILDASKLMRELVQKAAALTPVDALAYVSDQPIDLVKTAIVTAMPESWREPFLPLVTELGDDAARGVLCLIVGGYMQGANVRAVRQAAQAHAG